MQIISLQEIPLTSLPGNATRIIAKAVGEFLGETLSVEHEVEDNVSSQTIKGTPELSQIKGANLRLKTSKPVNTRNSAV